MKIQKGLDFQVCSVPYLSVCDACAEPHSECVRLGERPSLLYAGAHRRRIRQRETNLLRSERGDKRNPSSSEGDGQRGGTEGGDGTTNVV